MLNLDQALSNVDPFLKPLKSPHLADLKAYRMGYPGRADDPDAIENYLFYSGQQTSRPDNIHKKWWGAYQTLEFHHGYIQWLFPIREKGMNDESQPLQMHEIALIKENPKCTERFLTSYALILDFFGLKILDTNTGELARAPHYRARFHNLQNNSHNFLRITRILKSLGELGFEHFKEPFLDHISMEIWLTGELFACARSCRDFWVGTLKNSRVRKATKEKITELSGYLFPEESDDEEPEENIPKILESPSQTEPNNNENKPIEPKTLTGVAVADVGGNHVTISIPPGSFRKEHTCFHYLLTPVGGWTTLYVKKAYKNNQFVVGWGEALQSPIRINWQITATAEEDLGLDDMFSGKEDGYLFHTYLNGEVDMDDTQLEITIPRNSFHPDAKLVYSLTPIKGFAELFVLSKLKDQKFVIGCTKRPPKEIRIHWEIIVSPQ